MTVVVCTNCRHKAHNAGWGLCSACYQYQRRNKGVPRPPGGAPASRWDPIEIVTWVDPHRPDCRHCLNPRTYRWDDIRWYCPGCQTIFSVTQ